MAYSKKKGKFRSTLEFNVAAALKKLKAWFRYETLKIKYYKPVTYHIYTPDFVLKNGIIVEVKGLFQVSDRKKHLYVREQHPDLDIRFVFGNSKNKLYKGAKSTYADWCEKNDFKYADKEIPKEWIDE